MIRLKPAGIAALYALLALVNMLIYSPTRFEVLGFTDDPIGWWAMASILFTIAFCVLAIKIARQGRLHGTSIHVQPYSLQRLNRILIVLALLFALPNALIAVMHVGAIQMGFSYWGKVRAAYEVPFFHLLPLLLLLYWWFSTRNGLSYPTKVNADG